jgi:hypothetical protein
VSFVKQLAGNGFTQGETAFFTKFEHAANGVLATGHLGGEYRYG